MQVNFFNIILWILFFLSGISGLGVLLKQNPVHSVLCLILAFFSGSLLVLINNGEFLSMIIITVYVGAVAVLFLFVVMMVDMDHLKKNINKKIEIFLALIFGIGFFLVFFKSFHSEITGNEFNKIRKSIEMSLESFEKNQFAQGKISRLAEIIYDTNHIFSLITVSFVLFTAIIGVIVLSLREKTGLKKQNPISQNMRKKEETLEIKKVSFGVGVNDE
jgi:NADH-quinone oxidoreductase subunit J